MPESAAEAMAQLSVSYKDRPWEEIVAEKMPYYRKRIELFEGYREREFKKIEEAKAAGVPIKIILPDGAEKHGIKGATTPFDVANEISKSLAKKCVVAKVDGDTWDLHRPLEGDCALSLHSFDDAEGRDVSVLLSNRLLQII
jgi:threonyl-tRNA synthetase